MRERLRAFLNRPIESEAERRGALVIAAAVIAAAAVLFLVIGHGDEGKPGGGGRTKDTPSDVGSTATSSPQPPPEPIVGPTGDPIVGRAEPEIERPAREFFGSYVAAYYGLGSPRRIKAATPRLAARLAHTRPNTALRHRRPKVVAVNADRAGRGYRVGATVDDGASTGPFPLEARFERVGPGGAWRAVKLYAGE